MKVVAHVLNSLTGGRLSPNAITITGALAHLPIAWLIAQSHYTLAAVLLVIFGLFDTLDGELARLQKRASNLGMLLDSVTDRMKEILLYVGITYNLVHIGLAPFAVWAVAACGASVLTSYVNAWGDVVMSKAKQSGHVINQAFRGGILRFEVRMFLLVLGLLSQRLALTMIIIAVLASFTALQRLINISRRLSNV